MMSIDECVNGHLSSAAQQLYCLWARALNDKVVGSSPRIGGPVFCIQEIHHCWQRILTSFCIFRPLILKRSWWHKTSCHQKSVNFTQNDYNQIARWLKERAWNHKVVGSSPGEDWYFWMQEVQHCWTEDLQFEWQLFLHFYWRIILCYFGCIGLQNVTLAVLMAVTRMQTIVSPGVDP